MSAHPLNPQPGSPIDPKDAVGRRATTTAARAAFHAGNNLGLNDPRRMGKTVWLGMLCADPGEGLAAAKLDYEGVQSAGEFLTRTVSGLRDRRTFQGRAKDRLRAMFDGTEEIGGGSVKLKKGLSTRAPADVLADVFAEIDAAQPDDTLLVLAMDEVPMAIANVAESQGAEAANELLQTLRGARRSSARLRWIVCGSIGFHHVLRRAGATEGAINDLVNLPLGPLVGDEAEELASRLLAGIGRAGEAGSVARLVAVSGGIPWLIHGLAHHLRNAGTGAATADDVEAAFQAFMDDRDESRAATHLLTRLDLLYGDAAKDAERVLDRVAVGGRGASQPSAGLLDSLIDDHYLVQRDGVINWRYDVLRRIWVHRRRLEMR